jgi:hypothetical protein
MSARLFQLIKRPIAAKLCPTPWPVHAAIPSPGLNHSRDVKSFVERYGELQHAAAQAQCRNQEGVVADCIDQMRKMERRVRFVVVE